MESLLWRASIAYSTLDGARGHALHEPLRQEQTSGSVSRNARMALLLCEREYTDFANCHRFGRMGAGSHYRMSECKHGLKHGCAYCHAPAPTVVRQISPKKRTKASALSEKMNDRMTALKRRLREIRGE